MIPGSDFIARFMKPRHLIFVTIHTKKGGVNMPKKTISIEKVTPAKEQSQKLRLAQDFHLLSLLQFVAPSIVMMLFMGFYTIGDTAMVSRFIRFPPR